MSTTSYEYSKLSQEAQQKAREDFAGYYIGAFLADDLEIISGQSQKDTDMITINRLLIENKYLTRDQLRELSLKDNQANYDRILGALSMEYNQDGTAKTNWSDWVEAIRLKEPVED